MTAIVPLERSHAMEAARLHLDHLRTSFRGRAGRELLALYYATLAEGRGGCGYVAVSEGRVEGYICGVWNGAQLRCKFLRRHGVKAALWGAAQVLTHPRLLLWMARRLAGAGRTTVEEMPGYEARPLVIAPGARRKALGTQLVETIMADAARRGFASLHAFVEVSNAPSNGLLRKMGWEMAGDRVVGKIRQNIYRCCTGSGLS